MPTWKSGGKINIEDFFFRPGRHRAATCTATYHAPLTGSVTRLYTSLQSKLKHSDFCTYMCLCAQQLHSVRIHDRRPLPIHGLRLRHKLLSRLVAAAAVQVGVQAGQAPLPIHQRQALRSHELRQLLAALRPLLGSLVHPACSLDGWARGTGEGGFRLDGTLQRIAQRGSLLMAPYLVPRVLCCPNQLATHSCLAPAHLAPACRLRC